MESKGLNLFQRIRGIVEQGLGYLFVNSSTVVLIFSMKPISSSISLKYGLFGLAVDSATKSQKV